MSLIGKIWRRSRGEYFCISIKDPNKPKGRNWKDHFFKRSEIGKAIKFAQAHDSCDVYICPQGFTKPRRHKDNAVDPNVLFADLDASNPRQIDIKPTIALESSPGRYVGFWICDEPVTEELNRRLSYYVGADQSGWDWTQVLRAPGTINHKPEYDSPRVQVLWSDGPRHQTKRLERVVPQIETDDGQVEGGDATDIYSKYEKHMPRWLRKEFTDPKVQHGKRSEVLWKMINQCLEVGMSYDEVFTICWHSEWNKHAERRGGERQLEREIDKAMGRHVGGSKRKEPYNVKADKKEEDPTAGPFFKITPMSDVKEQNIEWLVPHMIARGETTIFEGDPGVGKSYFLMWLCAQFCDGKRLPWLDKKDKTIGPLKIAYFDTENSMATVTKTRLEDNGLQNGGNYYQLQEVFDLSDENAVEALEREIVIGLGIDLLIVDPITPYLGGADSHNAKEVRQSLIELTMMAQEHNFALVLVRHLNKSKSSKALYAGGGSIGFAGLARVVATVGWHPEEPGVRVVACTKNNLSRPFGSLGYTIEALPDTVKREDRSRFEYLGRVDYTSDDIIDTSNIKEDNSVNIASDLLREHMKEPGFEINYHSILKQADTRSISEVSLKKAAAELGLMKITKGRGTTRKTVLVDKSQSKD